MIEVGSLAQRAFYRGARELVRLANRAMFAVAVGFEEALPPAPYILAPTHRSNLDTPFIGSITGEPMTYMAKSGVMEAPGFGALLRLLGGFPVHREATDREAIELALAALGSGRSLVVFPEGTRRRGERVEGIEEGAAYLALRAGVPVVPAAIAGSERAMRPGSALILPAPVAIEVGRALWPGEVRASWAGRVRRQEIRQLSEMLESELNRLLAAARRSRALIVASGRRVASDPTQLPKLPPVHERSIRLDGTQAI
ncbi:phospholipid/glycerol acyltransferase [Acidimicrobium ferrooxidans DSM 10331]|uniref:Phospholipid/glycerol acyltransferase n=1 Tax=Acidimicrobium ferrooxidans (strain DSM 10331 / JCM 15462 / NBRC 103882 / ICP) TaxID=525909 RepID=C7LZW8_ACIFD|nr:lysophospholipid acyltransferase family protein [Acidimicrobium ferrooxidans]ACU54276.1 phospholipid/glycerol acyltransferase [Acidimicrobium ferrooxidans DSM 10331]